MKKYLHVISSFRPGGITSFIKSILSLNNEGNSRHYAALFNNSNNEFNEYILDISACKLNPKSAYNFASKASKEYEKIFIHSAGYLLTLNFVLKRADYFLFQHGMSVTHGNSIKRFLKRKWFSVIPFLLRSKIICSSEFAFNKTSLKGVNLSKKRMKIIPFGVSIPRKKEFNDREIKDRLIIGTAGRLAEIKRFDLLLNSLMGYDEELKIELRIAGDGPEHEKLLKISNSVSSEKVKIKFLGNISDMINFYDSIDIFVFPSHNESFGLVLIEALFRNVPVAVFEDVGGGRSVIENMKNGLIMDEGERGLRELWRFINANPNILSALSKIISESDYGLYQIRNTKKMLEEN